MAVHGRMILEGSLAGGPVLLVLLRPRPQRAGRLANVEGAAIRGALAAELVDDAAEKRRPLRDLWRPEGPPQVPLGGDGEEDSPPPSQPLHPSAPLADVGQADLDGHLVRCRLADVGEEDDDEVRARAKRAKLALRSSLKLLRRYLGPCPEIDSLEVKAKTGVVTL